MRVLTRPNLGGPTRQAIALWHAHRDLGIATLLVTGRVEAGEDELSPAEHGIPRLSQAEVGGDRAVAGGWVVIDELRRGIGPLRDRRAQRLLGWLMRAFRPAVVHTHTSKAGWLGRLAAIAARVPVTAHTYHGHVLRDYFGGVVSGVLRRKERSLARRTTLLFAVSPSCADELAELGVVARERVEIVPPAVDLLPSISRAAARAQLGIDPAARCVAAIGRFVPIKRLIDFVGAVGLDPGLRGELHGDGPERERLERTIAELAPGRVVLRGATPDVGAVLPAYDALLLPSVREGCPLVAIEAFAAGIPVVGYDVPGVRDALATWGCGLLVAENEGPRGLLAGLHRLEVDARLREICVAAGRGGLGRFAPRAVAGMLAARYRSAGAATP
jgi:glycosyltransferase involved in cell wall biosynthesis